MADIEEANKVRASLGMALLPTSTNGASNLDFRPSAESSSEEDDGEDPASTLETREAAGYENWKQLQDDAAEKKRRDNKRRALNKERDAAQRFAKLEGKGLGEVDQDIDTKSWLLGAKKREKKIAKQRAKRLAEDLAERENQLQYTDRDLAGKKVGHELGQFDEAGEQILTLKDAAIDDEEAEDELENMELREREKLEERLKLKKRKPVYDPNEDDGTGQRSVLAQYDEEIDGKKQSRFTLDGKGRTAEESTILSQPEAGRRMGVTISLDFFKDEKPISDYQDISEIKVRKPKKKKEKTKKRQATPDDVEATFQSNDDAVVGGTAHSMDLDSLAPKSNSGKRNFDDINFVDDDDLQSNLALQRRVALKKRRMDRPEDIARRLREEASATPMTIDTTEDADEGGLLIDETSEFVSNLQKPTLIEKTQSTAGKVSPNLTTTLKSPLSDDGGDLKMAPIEDSSGDESGRDSHLKRDVMTAELGITETGLDNEQTLDKGLGGTLAMLTGRGLLKTADSGDLNAIHRERQRFLAEKQKRENEAERKARLQREQDRNSGKFERMSAREREQYAQWENKHRDQHDSRLMAEAFNRDYKPNVDLKYVDEHGRHMDKKEAFKHLSHQFHGKGSGKQKTEKKLKKIEDEKKREAASTLDSSQSTGMNNVAGQTARKNRQAGIRLQ